MFCGIAQAISAKSAGVVAGAMTETVVEAMVVAVARVEVGVSWVDPPSGLGHKSMKKKGQRYPLQQFPTKSRYVDGDPTGADGDPANSGRR